MEFNNISNYPININLMQFLMLANNDAKFKAELAAGNQNSIDQFPGLSESDRFFLKSWDWSTIKINVSENSLKDFSSFGAVAGGMICETKCFKW